MTGDVRAGAPAAAIAEAEEADLPEILAIQNREIREGVALWFLQERTLDQVSEQRAARLAGGFPFLAARIGARVVGYGSFGPFRPHEGYGATVEHSLYVSPDVQGRGVGRALLTALEAAAAAQGRRVMVGAIEAGNAPSIALHRARGFEETARMPEVGRKFDRWLTLVMMQKRPAVR